ncbi:MAG: TlpA family protein disulfide reductase [Desulfovibrionaceae bacterium]|nr:TlpA family protein disulfide reductase [Desulfovibrionaceae bacterium]
MMMNLRAFLIALFLLPSCAFAQQQPGPEILFGAPLADLAGQPAALARFRGQPLIINFWARWCGPCQTEIPDIVAEYARAQSAGVQVVGIALDDKPDAVRDFAKAYDIGYPVLLLKDNGPDLLKQLGNPKAGLPYTLLVNRKGEIVERKLGAMSRADVVSAVDAVSK